MRDEWQHVVPFGRRWFCCRELRGWVTGRLCCPGKVTWLTEACDPWVGRDWSFSFSQEPSLLPVEMNIHWIEFAVGCFEYPLTWSWNQHFSFTLKGLERSGLGVSLWHTMFLFLFFLFSSHYIKCIFISGQNYTFHVWSSSIRHLTINYINTKKKIVSSS